MLDLFHTPSLSQVKKPSFSAMCSSRAHTFKRGLDKKECFIEHILNIIEGNEEKYMEA